MQHSMAYSNKDELVFNFQKSGCLIETMLFQSANTNYIQSKRFKQQKMKSPYKLVVSIFKMQTFITYLNVGYQVDLTGHL